MKKNYNYGKLIDGRIEYAPYPIRIDGYDVYGATEGQYLSKGYKKVVFEKQQLSESDVKSIFVQTANEIRVEYIMVENLE